MDYYYNADFNLPEGFSKHVGETSNGLSDIYVMDGKVYLTAKGTRHVLGARCIDGSITAMPVSCDWYAFCAWIRKSKSTFYKVYHIHGK